MEQSLSQVDKKGACSSWGFRHFVIFLTFLGTFIGYAFRVNLSVAIVAMVNNSQQMMTAAEFSNSSCASSSASYVNQSTSWLDDSSSDARRAVLSLGEKFDWDPDAQSFVLGALFYGAAIGQIPGAILTQRYGTQWVFGISTLIVSILCVVTPLAARCSATAVIALRFIQGLMQGTYFPAQYQTVSRWLPLTERGTGFTSVYNGLQIGMIVGLFLSGFLADSELFGGWPSVFYVFGTLGCLWSIVWMIMVTDVPEQNRYTSEREVEFIHSGQEKRQAEALIIPWKEILTSVPVWSQCVGIIGFSIGYFLLLTELPLYLSSVLDFNIKMSGALSSAPYVVHFVVASASGYISDALRKIDKLSITAVRKTMGCTGLIGSALCMACTPLFGCDKTLVVTMLCISSGISGMTVAGCQISAVDMSPNFSATLAAIASTTACLFGALVPYAVTLLTRSGQTFENWSLVFIVHAAIIAFTGLQFAIFGSSERQLWDYPKSTMCRASSKETMENGIPKEEITKF